MIKPFLQVVNDKEENICISEKNLGDFVGKPVFTSDKMYDTTPVSY
jgi:ATP-dependent Lon protease